MHIGLGFPNLCGGAVLLAFTLTASGQVNAEFHVKLIEAHLKDMRSMSRLIGDASDDLANANRKLSRQLPEDVKASPAWQDVEESQRKIDQAMQAFSKLLQNVVAAEDVFLGRVDRRGLIATGAVTDSLEAFANSQRAMSEKIATFVQQLEQQATAMRALPDSARDLPEFRYVKQVRDATVDALDDSARVCRKWTTEYESRLRSLKR